MVEDISFFDEDCAVRSDGGASSPASGGDLPVLFSRLRSHFEGRAGIFYAPDRSAAMALAFAAAAEEHSVYLCSGTSYAAGRGRPAIEDTAGMTPFAVPSHYGKLDPETIEHSLRVLVEAERRRCAIVSIAQPTEYGLVYTPEEIEAICRSAHEYGLRVLMDGSRLFFAAAHLRKAFREQTLFAGVDAATFGAAKNGAGGGEAVLAFDGAIAERLSSLQACRTIDLSAAAAFSAGFDLLLTFRLWRKRAQRANEAAAALGEALSGVPGIRPVCDVETNKVVADVTPEMFRRLTGAYRLRTFACPDHVVRFVTNYTTTDEEIERLVRFLR